LNISSSTVQTSQKSPDIDFLLEQHHNHTKEDKDIPYHEWIRFEDHLPLNEHQPILIYDAKWDSMYEAISFVQLQHALYDRYTKLRDTPSFWMRIKKPEV